MYSHSQIECNDEFPSSMQQHKMLMEYEIQDLMCMSTMPSKEMNYFTHHTFPAYFHTMPRHIQRSKQAPSSEPPAAACTLLCGHPRPPAGTAARSSARYGSFGRCAGCVRPRLRPQTLHTCVFQRENQAE